MYCILPFVQMALRDPLLYGDYRTALFPEQARVYEDIQDYDAAKGLFEEVCNEQYTSYIIYKCTCTV